ncbi:hypothetical protein [Rhodococcus globerulus]|uniref:Transposase n=1 Tax=Rhodococcus globerulus TaxID=33008 RepID=A0ABU4C4L2_RHOGO|nr:hypothetical protein [Rhodococcus globerulus]MDV6271427.1 hypothetical protein [Rhodococcus globerulus]
MFAARERELLLAGEFEAANGTAADKGICVLVRASRVFYRRKRAEISGLFKPALHSRADVVDVRWRCFETVENGSL